MISWRPSRTTGSGPPCSPTPPTRITTRSGTEISTHGRTWARRSSRSEPTRLVMYGKPSSRAHGHVPSPECSSWTATTRCPTPGTTAPSAAPIRAESRAFRPGESATSDPSTSPSSSVTGRSSGKNWAMPSGRRSGSWMTSSTTLPISSRRTASASSPSAAWEWVPWVLPTCSSRWSLHTEATRALSS